MMVVPNDTHARGPGGALFIATSQARSKPVQFSRPMEVVDALSILAGLDAFAVRVGSKIGAISRETWIAHSI